MEDLLSEFNAHLSSLGGYVHPTEELKARSLTALKTLFNLYKKYCTEGLGALEHQPGCRHVDTGPLSELFTEGLDNDQIWEQIQLVNKPVIKGLSGVVANISARLESGEFKLLKQHVASDADSSTRGADKTLKFGTGHGKLVEGEQEWEEEGEGTDSGDEEDDSCSEDESGRGKVKATGTKSVVDDRFFKLSEMEKFLEMAEKEDGKDVLVCD